MNNSEEQKWEILNKTPFGPDGIVIRNVKISGMSAFYDATVKVWQNYNNEIGIIAVIFRFPTVIKGIFEESCGNVQFGQPDGKKPSPITPSELIVPNEREIMIKNDGKHILKEINKNELLRHLIMGGGGLHATIKCLKKEKTHNDFSVSIPLDSAKELFKINE